MTTNGSVPRLGPSARATRWRRSTREAARWGWWLAPSRWERRRQDRKSARRGSRSSEVGGEEDVGEGGSWWERRWSRARAEETSATGDWSDGDGGGWATTVGVEERAAS